MDSGTRNPIFRFVFLKIGTFSSTRTHHPNFKGNCEYGEACIYAHTDKEIRSFANNLQDGATCPDMTTMPKVLLGGYKTSLCRNYTEKGICHYGKFCVFAHDSSEIRFSLANVNLPSLYHDNNNNEKIENNSSNDEDEETFDEKPKNRIKFVNPMISYATVLKL